MSRARTIILTLLSLLIVGCRRDASSGNVEFDKLSADSVLVKVGARQLTKAMFLGELKTRQALLKISDPKIDSEAIGRISLGLKAGIVDGFIQDSLIGILSERYFTTNAIEGVQALYQTNLVLVADEMSRHISLAGKKGVPAVAELLPSEVRKKFVEMNDVAVKSEAFLRTAYGKRFQLTDEQAQRGLDSLRDYNARAVATNALNAAMATNVLAQLRANPQLDFFEMADKWSQDPEKAPGGDLGECDENDFSDEEGYWERVSKMAVGEISDVISTSTGWEIVRRGEDISADKSDTLASAIRLARIKFRAVAVGRDDYTIASFKEEMQEYYHKQVMQQILMSAWKDVQTTFPSGYRKIGLKSNWEKVVGFPKDDAVHVRKSRLLN